MEFAYKDLMVSVFQARDDACSGRGGGPTGCCASYAGTYCEAGTAGSLHVVEPEMLTDLQEISFVKRQLIEALAGVDKREVELREARADGAGTLSPELGDALVDLVRRSSPAAPA
jgi:hypothetical protein